MQRIAVYPGSFDPITKGHIHLIERAENLFDHVIIVVAMNTRKQNLLTVEERVNIIQEIFTGYQSISVQAWDGLAVDFARQQGAKVIIRGIRVGGDYDNEQQLAGMNRHLAPEIDTLFLPAAGEFVCIAASLVREVYRLGGDISAFVPAEVASYLAKKMNNLI